jgi:hypothetical protein
VLEGVHANDAVRLALRLGGETVVSLRFEACLVPLVGERLPSDPFDADLDAVRDYLRRGWKVILVKASSGARRKIREKKTCFATTFSLTGAFASL